MFGWDDPLWEAEYEPGKIYKVRVRYTDGQVAEGNLRYLRPKVNPNTINGYESFIIPEFLDVGREFKVGFADMVEWEIVTQNAG